MHGARVYDPALGKFLSVDPVIDTNLPQQNTGYTYSGNNPTTYSDPSGMRFAFDNRADGGRADWEPFPVYAKPWTFKKPFIATPWRPATNLKKKLHLGLLDPETKLPPRPKVKNTPRDPGPGWGPLIEFNPDWRPPAPVVGGSIQGCFVVGCVSYELAADGSQGFGVTLGPHLGVSGTVGVSQSTDTGLYLVGECATQAGVGVGVQAGLGYNGKTTPEGDPIVNTMAGAGFSFGAGVGCSAGAKFTWK